jgi:hypothetical protein
MDMNAVYREVGSYRAAAAICGTTHRTVKRSVLAARAGENGETSVPPHNYDQVKELVAERVERSKGRISAKRLLPIAETAGYSGSDRNFRRLVAEMKNEWKQHNHRGRRPGVWAPGDMVVFDWGEIGPLFVFCAVVAWSRMRFVFFADNLGAESTMTALATPGEENLESERTKTHPEGWVLLVATSWDFKLATDRRQHFAKKPFSRSAASLGRIRDWLRCATANQLDRHLRVFYLDRQS